MSEKRIKVQLLTQMKQSEFESFIFESYIQDVSSSEDKLDVLNVHDCTNL